MASFSFGSGNAGKLLRIPLYLAGRLATAVIPRSRGDWVFGCSVGVSDGALALWRESERSGRVWLVADDRQAQDAAALGIPTVRRDSWRGFWATARARVVVVTHGFGDVNRYAVGGAFVVQLWHGIPFKRIGLDAPVTTDAGRWRRVPGVSRLLAALYRRTQRQISLLPAASHLVRGRLETAFGFDDGVVRALGEPRVDVLSAGAAADRRIAALSALAEAVGDLGTSRVVLYAPTWRDGAPDPAVPTAADWTRLIDVLDATDAVLLVRSHPLGAGDYTPPVATDRVRQLGSGAVADVTPLLPAVDVLVTDYSSLAYDIGLVPAATLFLAPDTATYAVSRGFYGDPIDVLGDDPARDWATAADQLRTLLSDPREAARRRGRAAALSERVHAWRDGHNARRVHAAVVAAVPAAGEERA